MKPKKNTTKNKNTETRTDIVSDFYRNFRNLCNFFYNIAYVNVTVFFSEKRLKPFFRKEKAIVNGLVFDNVCATHNSVREASFELFPKSWKT